MNTDASCITITSRLKQLKRRRESPAESVSFDVSQLVPERPLPDWIQHRANGAKRHRRKVTVFPRELSRGGESTKIRPLANKKEHMILDLNNMRKDWKSTSTKRIEAVQRARILQNRQPEPVRCFPGDARPVSIPSDSPVVLFALSGNAGRTRKKFGPPTVREATDAQLELNDCADSEEKDSTPPVLLENTHLNLDQSKLPLEVSTGWQSDSGRLPSRRLGRNTSNRKHYSPGACLRLAYPMSTPSSDV